MISLCSLKNIDLNAFIVNEPDRFKYIMKMVVEDCSPIHWNLSNIKKSLLKLMIVTHPDKNPNTRIWFETIVKVKELLTHIDICSDLLFLTKRDIFYKLGCCEYHLLYDNRNNECVESNPCFNQFIRLFKIHFPLQISENPKSIAETFHILKCIIENKRIDYHEEGKMMNVIYEDFNVNVAYILTRNIIKWIISKSDNTTQLYQEISNLPICKPLESLEERRKFTEDLIARIIRILIPKKEPEKLPEKQRSFDDIILLSQKDFTIQKPNIAPRQIYEYCVKVPKRKYTSKWYKRALDYGTKYPNKWHPRKLLASTSIQEYHNMRGTLILKESTNSKSRFFPMIESNEIRPGMLLMKQDFITRKIYFKFTS